MISRLQAQPIDSTSLAKLGIPPLEVMIDTAIVHSPLLKAQLRKIDGLEEEIRMERKKWLDYLYVEGSANYGVYDNLIVNEVSDGINLNPGILSRNEQVRYYGGVSLKLPLSALTSRSNSVKTKRLKQEEVNFEMMQHRENIRILVVEEYFQLIYLLESMNTYNRISQTLEISLLKAEKDLVNGRIEFDEYGILASTAGKSKNEYIKAKNNFYAQYNKLEEITGLVFNQKME